LLVSIAGALAPIVDPAGFVSSQLAHIVPHNLYPTEQVLSLQLGNLYLLLCLLGVFILNTTTEARVVHAYVWALWIADIGHVAGTAWVMGYDAFIDVGRWNAMAYGNIGATVFLFATRTLYLLGLLGRDRVPGHRKKNI